METKPLFWLIGKLPTADKWHWYGSFHDQHDAETEMERIAETDRYRDFKVARIH